MYRRLQVYVLWGAGGMQVYAENLWGAAVCLCGMQVYAENLF